MDWDLENKNLELERMIIIYQQEIEKLEEEKLKLKEEIIFLREQLDYKSNGLPNPDINTKELL